MEIPSERRFELTGAGSAEERGVAAPAVTGSRDWEAG